TNAGSVTVGATKVDNSGVQAGSIRLDAVTGKITGVMAGESATDAVNVGQLSEAQAAATTKVNAGDNIAVTPTLNTNGSTTYTVETKKDVAFDTVQVGNVAIDSTTNKITGVEDGTVAAGSKDVVNGGQLFITNQNVTTAQNAADTAQATADKGFALADQSGNVINKALGEAVTVKGGNSNINTSVVGGELQINLNDNLSLTSVTTGLSKVDNSGV
ncbi:hypothetical protein ACFO9P_15905, partial [Acinetobacter puyangensis]